MHKPDSLSAFSYKNGSQEESGKLDWMQEYSYVLLAIDYCVIQEGALHV